MPLKVFVINDSSPEFVEPQLASFNKYLQEDFEFTLFNGETTGMKPEKAKEVSEICRGLSIPVVEIPRDEAVEKNFLEKYSYGTGSLFTHDGRYKTIGQAGNYMLQWVWDKVISKESGPICFIHSDVFLIEPIKLSDYLKEHTIASVIQRYPANEKRCALEYLWEPLFLADMGKFPDREQIEWWPSYVEGEWTDTGGQIHYFLKNHPDLKILEITQSGSHQINGEDDDPNVDFHPSRYRFFHLGDKRIFHYLSGSRWCTDMKGYWGWSKEKSDEYHARKLAWTRKLIGLKETA